MGSVALAEPLNPTRRANVQILSGDFHNIKLLFWEPSPNAFKTYTNRQDMKHMEFETGTSGERGSMHLKK